MSLTLIIILICIGFLVSATVFFMLYLIVMKIYLKFRIVATCPAHSCMIGKTVIVTGANKGMGYWVALDFAKRGAKVILACRNKTKAKEAIELIQRETENKNCVFYPLNLASFKSVRAFVHEVKKNERRLDVLVNNAGVVRPNAVTEDGFHPTLQVNALGPFLLTILLMDLLKSTKHSRIVNVTTKEGSEHFDILEDLVDKSNSWFAYVRNYENSKKCLGLLMTALSEKLLQNEVTVQFAVPRPCHTDLQIYENLPDYLKFLKRHIFITFLCLEASESAVNTIFTALDHKVGKSMCKYYRDCEQWDPGHQDTEVDTYLRKKIWWKCVEYVQLKPNEFSGLS